MLGTVTRWQLVQPSLTQLEKASQYLCEFDILPLLLTLHELAASAELSRTIISEILLVVSGPSWPMILLAASKFRNMLEKFEFLKHCCSSSWTTGRTTPCVFGIFSVLQGALGWGGGGGGVGGGVLSAHSLLPDQTLSCCCSHRDVRVVVAVPLAHMSPDSRLALALILLLRLGGRSHVFADHPVLSSFFLVHPEYLDSLLDTCCQTPDPILGFVNQVVEIECRFPLQFRSLSACAGHVSHCPRLSDLFFLAFSVAGANQSLQGHQLNLIPLLDVQ